MPIVERYIFRTGLIAFLAGLFILTATIWVTQALREVDLLTSKGQTLLIFFHLTLLTIPSLVMILAPVALFIAVVYTLNRFNSDSELVVMSSAGMSPRRLLRPFMLLAVLVMVLSAVISLWAMPSSFRTIRDLITLIRTDVLTRIVREGQFVTLTRGFVFHYRERGQGGSLQSIFIQDRRDPNRINTYIAERGRTVESGEQMYLVLDKGSVQRQSRGNPDPAIVTFERYAIDLAQFNSEGPGAPYKPRERPTTELLNLDASEPYVRTYLGRFRAELHDRFAGPLYAIVLALIAFAALGQPRTTRQSRGWAIGWAVIAVAVVRLSGFAASGLVARSPQAYPIIYLPPLLGGIGAFLAIIYPHWPQLLWQRIAGRGGRKAAAA